MPPNGSPGSRVPLGNNYIISAGGLLVICEEQGGGESGEELRANVCWWTSRGVFYRLKIFKSPSISGELALRNQLLPINAQFANSHEVMKKEMVRTVFAHSAAR